MSNTQPIEANRGILAGCAFAVHYLKAMIKEDVKDENNELIYYVDDMALFKEGDTEEEAIRGLYNNLTEAKHKLPDIGQVQRQERAYLGSEQDKINNLAPDQPRLQGKSRTS
eukprot:5967703-Heterocapsa_arctica.AAC.1